MTALFLVPQMHWILIYSLFHLFLCLKQHCSLLLPHNSSTPLLCLETVSPKFSLVLFSGKSSLTLELPSSYMELWGKGLNVCLWILYTPPVTALYFLMDSKSHRDSDYFFLLLHFQHLTLAWSWYNYSTSVWVMDKMSK